FADACDAITYEFENVPSGAVEILSAHKPSNPNARALAVAQDRMEEKNFVRKLGLGTADFIAVNSEKDAREAFAKLGQKQAILKTCRLGYDGKGQQKVTNGEDAAKAFAKFAAPSLLESFVDFAFEASVVAARGIDGEFAAYDP